MQDDEEHEVEKYLDMPPSWVDALKLSHRGMDDYFIWKCFGTVHVGMVVMSKLKALCLIVKASPRWSKSLGLLIYYFFQCQVLYDCNNIMYTCTCRFPDAMPPW